MAQKFIALAGLAAIAFLNLAGCATPDFGTRSEVPSMTDSVADGAVPAPLVRASPALVSDLPVLHPPPTQPEAGGSDAPPSQVGHPPTAPVVPSPLTLAEAINMAVLANPDLKSAIARTEYGEGVLAGARAQFLPVLNLNQDYQISNNALRKFSFLLNQGVATPNKLFPLPQVVDNFHNQFHLQQDLYTGGLRLARRDAAEADRDASNCSLAAVLNRMVYQVAEAYYRAFQARALLAVRRDSVSQAESELRAVRSRFGALSAARSDVLKAEVRVAEAREASLTADNAYHLSLAILENVTGVPLRGRHLPDELAPAPWSDHLDRLEATACALSDIDPTQQPDEVEAIVAVALEHRPEIGEVSNSRRAAEHRVRAARSGKYPTVSVVGDYDINTGDFRQGNESYFFGLALSLNLFDGGRTCSNVQQTRALVHEVAARNQRVRLDIELDVRKTYLQLKDARERVTVTASIVTRLEENLRQTESRFRQESATTTELLEATVLLSDARVRSVSAAADVEIARASLRRAAGRLTDFLVGVAPR